MAPSSVLWLCFFSLFSCILGKPFKYFSNFSTRDAGAVEPSMPSTGVTRTYNWTIARGNYSPDGYVKSGLLINGQFPGPAIEADWGDQIEVTVYNGITGPEEGTGMHWHGILQTGTPFMDGVPSVSQCALAPGKSYTYTFTADSYGASFYHSHYSAQYTDGAFGPIVINKGPTSAPYDIDLGPLLLTDYFHGQYFQNVESILKRPPAPTNFPNSDNNLINGKTNNTFHFQSGKVHRFQLINAGGDALQRFSIDNHQLTVIAKDFVPVVPYETSVVSLGVGQRAEVLVNATGKPTDAVWLRSNISTTCSLHPLQPYAKAVILYEQAPDGVTPNSSAQPYVEANCLEEPLNTTQPFFPATPPPAPATTTTIVTTVGLNETGFGVFFENNSSFHGDYNAPVLLLAAANNISYPDPEWNVYNYGSNNSMRIILTNPTANHHPMHLHGHNYWVLAQGTGTWDGEITNPQNPLRRDTHILAPGSAANPTYLVIEFEANNPGVWALHCHIAWHVSLGLYVNILEAPAKIPGLARADEVAQTCRDWATWSGQNVVDEIDSGL